LFSEFSKPLDAAERAALLAQHYFPHREAVESWIDEQVSRRREVVHIGVHSFTPRLDGQVRTADVGLLYDPARAGELQFCREWKAALRALDATLRVRRNYPFLGKADGFVTHLRGIFPRRKYLGIELEVNQSRLAAPGPSRRLTRLIAESLAAVLPPAR
jgi:predicted N-formylglutamate amidohydrolase